MRARGFLEWATDYISRHPGRTAQEIAQACLDLSIVTSVAQDPVASLVATLHKHHSDQGRRVVRRREGGSYRFYPSNASEEVVESLETKPDKSTSTDITDEQLQQFSSLASGLVKAGIFETRREALVWLIQER